MDIRYRQVADLVIDQLLLQKKIYLFVYISLFLALYTQLKTCIAPRPFLAANL